MRGKHRHSGGGGKPNRISGGGSPSSPSTTRSGSRKGKASPKQESDEDESESARGLQTSDLPDMTPFDHVRHALRFQALVSRDADMDPATVDELDPLQHDLEEILLHDVGRQRSIAQLLNALSPGATTLAPSTSQAAKNKDRPVFLKRGEEADARAKTGKMGRDQRTPSASCRTPKDPFAPQLVGGVINVPIPSRDSAGRRRIYFWPQNHMPDKFWEFVGEYCDRIGEDDVDKLRELLQECDEQQLDKYLKVPARGKHYALRWADEDSKRKDGVSGRKLASPPISPTTSRRGGHVSSSLKRKLSMSHEEDADAPSEKAGRKSARLSGQSTPPHVNGKSSVGKRHSSLSNGYGGASSVMGPLTEKLVQALIEEQSYDTTVGANEQTDRVVEMPEVNGVISPNKALLKSLNLGNMAALERRIKRELEAQGLLDIEDDSDEDLLSVVHGHKEHQSSDGDDVTEELHQRQRELTEVATANRRRLGDLLRKGQLAANNGNVCAQLEAADAHIRDLYSKYYSVVPKRKPCNKKERDGVAAAISKRQQLLARLKPIT